MILQTADGNEHIQTKGSWIVQSPGSWDAGMLSSLGVTEWSRSWAPGGIPRALYIPAVTRAVKLVSEAVGSMVMRTYTGDALERQPVYDSPQAYLFQDPAPSLGGGSQGYSKFDFWSDIAAAVETSTAAFVWKVLDAAGDVIELWPLDPAYFQIKGQPDTRQVVGYHNGKLVDVTDNVTVIRSWAGHASADGWSTLDMHDQTFKWGRMAEEYRGRYFQTDGTVEQVIENAPATKDGRDDLALSWVVNRRKSNLGMLWGGATLKAMNPSMNDAQAAELSVAIAQDVARAYGIYPAFLLYADAAPERFPTLEMPRGIFYSWTLSPRMRRIEGAFNADRQIFPDRNLYARFDASEFLRADTATLATIAHDMVQDGSMNKDESRALVIGLPPIPDGKGKTYQETPVGGAPNQSALRPGPAVRQMSIEDLEPAVANGNGGHDA